MIYHNGMLYGATTFGGTDGYGTVFSMDPNTGAETVLYSFTGYDDGGGPFYLMYHDGHLFGTTTEGGRFGYGVLFRVSTRAGGEHVLYAFRGGKDGGQPISPLTYNNEVIYGSTGYGGGNCGCGVIFSYDLATHAERVLHAFNGGADGSYPIQALTYVDGTLYGSADGGVTGAGLLYALDTVTATDTVLYNFAGGTDGADPDSSLVYDAGTLYGATSSGGKMTCHRAYCGTIFKFDIATGSKSLIASVGEQERGPGGNLVLRQGTLVGVGEAGAVYGSIFKVGVNTGKVKQLYSFTGGADGANPDGVIYSGGAYYGTTTYGALGAGTVFKLVP